MNESPMFEQATLCLEQDDYENAIALLKQCIELNANEINYYWYLGLAYFLNNDETLAGELWFSLLLENNEFSPFLVKMLSQEADRRLKKRQFILAAKLYQVLIELEEQASFYLYLGDALSQQGLFDEAIESWQQAIAVNPALVESYQRQGQVWQVLRDYSQAIAAYQQGLAIAPNNETILYQLSLCFLEINEEQKSLECLKNYLELNPKDSHIYGQIGMIFFKNQQPQQAIPALQKMVWGQTPLFQAYLDWEQAINRASLSNRTLQNNQRFIQSLMAADCDWQTLRIAEKANSPDFSTHPITNHLQGPVGFYKSAREWATNSHHALDSFQPIFPKTEILLKPPHTVENHILFSFRFGDRVPLPASFVVNIHQGCFFLNQAESCTAVITSDNQLIGDLSPESPALSPNHPDKHPSKHSLLSRKNLPEVTYVDGNVVVLLGILNNIYFHWLFDILPRIHLLKKSHLNWENIDYFLVYNHQPFQVETLALLGVEEHQILAPEISEDLHLQAHNLIVPSFPGTVAWMPPWACQFLRDLFPEETNPRVKPRKRIYIRRDRSASRRLINEEEVIQFLKPLGFIPYRLELLSVQEQARLFAEAEIIVSPHGSGLSNLVFCQKNTQVIEIFSPFYVYPCYWLVSNLVDLQYYYVVGEIIGSDHFHRFLYPDSREEDIYLDCHRLADLLKLAKV